jgi:hypothetical protein
MASIRELKKNINVQTGELLNKCFTFTYRNPESKPKQVTETMWALAHTRNELISRVNRKIPKENKGSQFVRAFYKTVKTDIAEMPSMIRHINP